MITARARLSAQRGTQTQTHSQLVLLLRPSFQCSGRYRTLGVSTCKHNNNNHNKYEDMRSSCIHILEKGIGTSNLLAPPQRFVCARNERNGHSSFQRVRAMSTGTHDRLESGGCGDKEPLRSGSEPEYGSPLAKGEEDSGAGAGMNSHSPRRRRRWEERTSDFFQQTTPIEVDVHDLVREAEQLIGWWHGQGSRGFRTSENDRNRATTTTIDPHNNISLDPQRTAKWVWEHLVKYVESSSTDGDATTTTTTGDERAELVTSMTPLLNAILKSYRGARDVRNALATLEQYISYADTTSFHIVLDLCSERRLSQEAESLLLRMVSMSASTTHDHNNVTSNDNDIQADTVAFNLVLKAQRVPERARSILERMVYLSEERNHSMIHPDLISFHTVMDAYVKSDDLGLQQDSNGIVEDDTDHPTNSMGKDSLEDFRYYDDDNDEDDAQRCGDRAALVRRILSLMKRQPTNNSSNNNEYIVRPNVVTFNILMNAHARDGDTYLAERLLQRMKHREDLPDPDVVTYVTLAKSLCERGDFTRAETIFRESSAQLSSSSSSSSSTLSSSQLTTEAFNGLIRALCNEGQIERAERFLRDMFHDLPDLLKHATTYNILIDAYSLSNKPTQADRILQEMESLMEENETEEEGESTITTTTKLTAAAPTSFSYNSVVASYAANGLIDSALKVLKRMEHQRCFKNNVRVMPDTITFNTVLSGCSKATGLQVRLKAASILAFMETVADELSSESNQKLRKRDDEWNPDDNDNNNDSNNDTNDLAFQAARPDVVSYTIVVKCWALSATQLDNDDDADVSPLREIETLLTKMERLEDEGLLQLNNVAYNTYLDAYARVLLGRDKQKQRKSQHFQSRPNHSNHLDHDDDEDPYKFCTSLLRRMKERVQRNPNSEAMPDSITYNTILKILVGRGLFEQAEDVWNEMEDLSDRYHEHGYGTEESSTHPQSQPHPNIYDDDLDDEGLPRPRFCLSRSSYRTLLFAYAKYHKYAPKAIELFQRCLLTGHIEPDVSLYNAVSIAHAKLRDPESAEANLRQLLLANNNNTNPNLDLEPNFCSYDVVMIAWMEKARELRRQRNWKTNTIDDIDTHNNTETPTTLVPSEHVLQLFQEMKDNPNIPVDLKTYHVVLQAMSADLPQEGNIDTALRLLDETATVTSAQEFLRANRGPNKQNNQNNKNQRLTRQTVGPNVDTLNAVLRVCLAEHPNTRGSLDAIKVAMELWREVTATDPNQKLGTKQQPHPRRFPPHVRPDNMTYELMVQIVSKHFPIRRNRSGSENSRETRRTNQTLHSVEDVTEQLFRRACREGWVTKGLLDEVASALETSMGAGTGHRALQSLVWRILEDDRRHHHDNSSSNNNNNRRFHKPNPNAVVTLSSLPERWKRNIRTARNNKRH